MLTVSLQSNQKPNAMKWLRESIQHVICLAFCTGIAPEICGDFSGASCHGFCFVLLLSFIVTSTLHGDSWHEACRRAAFVCFPGQASAQSDERNLSYDVILCSMGARYKSYCANVSRSFFINPPKKVGVPSRPVPSHSVRLISPITPYRVPSRNVSSRTGVRLRKEGPEGNETTQPHLPTRCPPPPYSCSRSRTRTALSCRCTTSAWTTSGRGSR